MSFDYIKTKKLMPSQQTGFATLMFLRQLLMDIALRLKKSKIQLKSFLLWTLLSSLIVVAGCIERQLIKPTTQMNIDRKYWIRVLLFEDAVSCKIKSWSNFQVLDPQTETILADFRKTTKPVKVTVANSKFIIDNQTIIAGQIIIIPDRPHIFNINGRDYRGKLKLIIKDDGRSFDAVNLVPLEPYLAGVVGAEMPDYWDSAALQAQAIAARTYALYIKKRFGPKRNWDVKKTQANQTYHGVSAESKRVWDAVNKTYGEVLDLQLPDGTKRSFPSYYSTVCGGHTENSQHVFGGDFYESLKGISCPYCKQTAKPTFFYWPMVQFDKELVTAKLIKKYPKLKQLGKIISITAKKESVYENENVIRITAVKLKGSTGKSDSLRAEDLRLSIDPTGRKIKSTICKIVSTSDKWIFVSGQGFGHGVGMCQYGAHTMARKGENAEQILSHYYPGSIITSLY